MLCERKRWLTREEFLELLSVAQVLPGPNICNLSLMIGDRFFGWRGALAALGGMMLLPLMLVLLVTAFYVQHAGFPMVAGALRGMGAVSAGMIAGTGLKLSSALRHNPMGLYSCLALAVAAFVAVALLRWPLVWVLLVLGVVACARAWHGIPRANASRR
jgi:chromate transporter